MHVEFEDFDLTAVAAEVLRETEMIDQTHQFSACWEENVTVHADVGRIKQAMRILVDNSIKYTPAGGAVRVSASANQMFSAIHVADNGPGIPEDEQPRVFQRFYRGLSNPTEEGVGIGLYLVRQIAEGQGGYVKVSSKPGEGSTFSLYLPREICQHC